MNISTIADQSNDHEVTELIEDQILEAHDTVAKKMCGLPASQDELTAEQLTALVTILKGSGSPYVDFSTWRPFGHRIAKRSRFSGLMFAT